MVCDVEGPRSVPHTLFGHFSALYILSPPAGTASSDWCVCYALYCDIGLVFVSWYVGVCIAGPEAGAC